VEWVSLLDAYEPADGIPVLLAAVSADVDDRRAWDELWGRVCHQGTIYSASCPALPR